MELACYWLASEAIFPLLQVEWDEPEPALLDARVLVSYEINVYTDLEAPSSGSRVFVERFDPNPDSSGHNR